LGKGILLLGNHPPPFGGVPAHIQYLAPYLASKDWDVHVLSIEHNSFFGGSTAEKLNGYTVHRPSGLLSYSRVLFPKSFAYESLKFWRLASTSPKTFIILLGYANILKEIITKNDIKIVSAYHVLSGLISAWVCAELSIPLITTVFGEIYANPSNYKSIKPEVEYLISKSYKILSCSRHCALSFKEIDLNPNVEAIYYGIDIFKFTPENNGTQIRLKYGIPNSDKILIYVGRMVEEMGLHVFLKSIPEVLTEQSNTRFFVVGRQGSLLQHANELASKFPKNVYVVPDLPLDALPLYYAASDVAVVPSINDRACLGLAIAEAMASGKPAIVSNIGGGPEVVSSGKSGYLVAANDSHALAKEILKVLALDGALLRDMGRYGRDRAIEFFDKEVTNRRMEDIFLEALR